MLLDGDLIRSINLLSNAPTFIMLKLMSVCWIGCHNFPTESCQVWYSTCDVDICNLDGLWGLRGCWRSHIFKVSFNIKKTHFAVHLNCPWSHYSKSQIFVQKFNFDKTLFTFSRVFHPNFFDNYSREIKVVNSKKV